MPLSDQARDIFSDKAIVHIGFVDDAGKPHVTAVWVDVLDDGRIEYNTALGRKKDALTQPGAPVALSATKPGDDYQHVLVNGTVVERTTDGADESIDRLAKKYLGADSYPFRQPGEQRLKVIIQPD
jgi:hypothetical protein